MGRRELSSVGLEGALTPEGYRRLASCLEPNLAGMGSDCPKGMNREECDELKPQPLYNIWRNPVYPYESAGHAETEAPDFDYEATESLETAVTSMNTSGYPMGSQIDIVPPLEMPVVTGVDSTRESNSAAPGKGDSSVASQEANGSTPTTNGAPKAQGLHEALSFLIAEQEETLGNPHVASQQTEQSESGSATLGAGGNDPDVSNLPRTDYESTRPQTTTRKLLASPQKADSSATQRVGSLDVAWTDQADVNERSRRLNTTGTAGGATPGQTGKPTAYGNWERPVRALLASSDQVEAPAEHVGLSPEALDERTTSVATPSVQASENLGIDVYRINRRLKELIPGESGNGGSELPDTTGSFISSPEQTLSEPFAMGSGSASLNQIPDAVPTVNIGPDIFPDQVKDSNPDTPVITFDGPLMDPLDSFTVRMDRLQPLLQALNHGAVGLLSAENRTNVQVRRWHKERALDNAITTFDGPVVEFGDSYKVDTSKFNGLLSNLGWKEPGSEPLDPEPSAKPKRSHRRFRPGDDVFRQQGLSNKSRKRRAAPKDSSIRRVQKGLDAVIMTFAPLGTRDSPGRERAGSKKKPPPGASGPGDSRSRGKVNERADGPSERSNAWRKSQPRPRVQKGLDASEMTFAPLGTRDRPARERASSKKKPPPGASDSRTRGKVNERADGPNERSNAWRKSQPRPRGRQSRPRLTYRV
eukprot:scaffold4916_cov371-Prasinococcus_capsulatus_cf.AAC.4